MKRIFGWIGVGMGLGCAPFAQAFEESPRVVAQVRHPGPQDQDAMPLTQYDRKSQTLLVHFGFEVASIDAEVPQNGIRFQTEHFEGISPELPGGCVLAEEGVEGAILYSGSGTELEGVLTLQFLGQACKKYAKVLRRDPLLLDLKRVDSIRDGAALWPLRIQEMRAPR